MAASADDRADLSRGAVQVVRMCCVQDVGIAINPGQLEAQIEGNLIWGLGMTLMERVEIGQSDIASRNFDRYSVPLRKLGLQKRNVNRLWHRTSWKNSRIRVRLNNRRHLAVRFGNSKQGDEQAAGNSPRCHLTLKSARFVVCFLFRRKNTMVQLLFFVPE